MFKAIKNGKIIGINETDEFPLMNYESLEEDTEHQLSDYIQVNDEYVLTSSDEAIEQDKQNVRNVRNRYLEQTDKYLSISDFPITEEERESYKQYRTYLRDYTLEDEWWLANPKTFEEWSVKMDSVQDELPHIVEEQTIETEAETEQP